MENDITSPNAINARAEKPCFLNQDLKLNSGRTSRRSHHRDRKKNPMHQLQVMVLPLADSMGGRQTRLPDVLYLSRFGSVV